MIRVAGSVQRHGKSLGVRRWIVGAVAVVLVAAIVLLNTQSGQREKPDSSSAITVRPGKAVASAPPAPVTLPAPEKPSPAPASAAAPRSAAGPNAEIVAHFISNGVVTPAGYPSVSDLHKRIMTEERDGNAAAVERGLADHLRSLPGLDPALIRKGVTCVRTLCQITGAFRNDGSTAEMGDGLHDLQNIAPGKLAQLGVKTALITAFDFNPKTRRQEYMIFFTRP